MERTSGVVMPLLFVILFFGSALSVMIRVH
jgi:hypothetical protein